LIVNHKCMGSIEKDGLMERLQIAILNASYNDGHTSRNFRREMGIELVEYDITRGDLPLKIDFDAVVITGSRSSVYGDESWIQELIEWLRESVGREIPHLGICFGHQILAEVLGGSVKSMGDFEIGYKEIDRIGESMLFEGIPEKFISFSSHGDIVVEIPPGGNIIAKNEYGIQGWNKGLVWAVQFHPEYDLKTVIETTRKKEGTFVTKKIIDKILYDSTNEMYYRVCETKKIFDNFIRYVENERLD